MDKASIVSEAEKAIADREAVEKESRLNPRVKSLWKKRSEIQCRKRSEQTQTPQSPKQTKALCQGKTQEPVETQSDKGVAKPVEKPSVKEKLDRYKTQAKQQKEAERKEPEVKKDGKKPQQKNGQTVHRQPKKKPKTKRGNSL